MVLMWLGLWMAMAAAVTVVGSGPAGLMAAEILAKRGFAVTILEQMAAPARKFLMAGRGGLNLTHSEPLKDLLDRYGPAQTALEPAIRSFPPTALRDWCHGLGIQTFVGSSGRIFPTSLKASPLLRAWLRRLDGLGVSLRLRTRWQGFDGTPTVLALGGASWPRLGSDGAWVHLFRSRGIVVNDFSPANAGVIVPWSEHFAGRHAGSPLKRIAVTVGRRTVRGEALVTSYGLEGGAIYALSHDLREAGSLTLDLRPDLSETELARRLAAPRGSMSTSNWLRRRAGLSPAAIGLLRETEISLTAASIKGLRLKVGGVAGLARAISSAGGVALDEVDGKFQLHKSPGTFVVGEMLDWEAPTGGYLLQACFSMGYLVGSQLEV